MTVRTAEANKDTARNSLDAAALAALPVRLVVGWTYFSAFWRRAVLEQKLDPNVAGYIGEKFNHFLPNALGIGPVIEYMVTHPDLLRLAMTLFTIVEAIVGVCVILGLFTRIMSLGMLALAFGILIGSGWLGTTCLDEWQIGILGVASGFMLFLSGGGHYSLDNFLRNRNVPFVHRRWFKWSASGKLDMRGPVVLTGSMVILALALFTNQHFHGGVYGPLHNKSVAPIIKISGAAVEDGILRFQLYRTEGVDVYGSFLIGIAVVDDKNGDKIVDLNGSQLSKLPDRDISNHYVTKVKPGAHSLLAPLGARAELAIDVGTARFHADHNYTLLLTDISGATWEKHVEIGG